MLSCGEGLNSKPCCYPPCSLQYGKLALNIDVKKCHFLWLNKRKESWDQVHTSYSFLG
uniref:Uncharacterized protein n=1 Tax=Arundo donax TaxID=35708 RepID=A0A0A9DZ05_ARUDO